MKQIRNDGLNESLKKNFDKDGVLFYFQKIRTIHLPVAQDFNNIIIMWILLSLLSLVMADNSYSLRFELGLAQSLKNEFQIPKETGTSIGLDQKNIFYGRFEGLWNFNPRQSLRLVVAPYEVEQDYVSSTPFTFDQQPFLANTAARVGYKFNSYRLSYLHHFFYSQPLTLTVGGTLKIRDARIFVAQNGIKEQFTDFGFVPLLYLGARYQFHPDWALNSNVDGAGSPQGFAVDGVIEAQYKLRESSHLGLGWRYLGGGANNDTVKTFASIQYWQINATHFF